MKKFILFILFTCQLFATNYYVGVTASGSGNASSWDNKDDAATFNFNGLSAGDVVYLDGGATGDSLIYTSFPYDFSYSGSSGNPITVTRDLNNSSHNGIPIINRTGTTRTVQFSGDYLLIENLQFMNTDNSSCSGGFEIVWLTGDYITFQNNTVYYQCSKAVRVNGTTGVKVLNNLFDTGVINVGGVADGMWLGGQGENIEIAYNQILMRNAETGSHKDNIQTYMWQTNGSTGYGTTKIHHNFFYSDGSDCTILELSAIGGDWEVYDNILVYRNTGAGRAMYLGNCVSEGANDILFSAKVYNNTIYAIGSSTSCASFMNTDTLIFKNNLLYHSGVAWTGLIIDPAMLDGVLDVDYNQYVSSTSDFIYNITSCPTSDIESSESYSWATWRSTYGQDAHSEAFTNTSSFDFVGNSFPSTTADDYALEGSSSGIDEGTSSVGGLFTTDFNGNTRTGTWDVGAFEYGSLPPPTQTKKVRVIIIQ